MSIPHPWPHRAGALLLVAALGALGEGSAQAQEPGSGLWEAVGKAPDGPARIRFETEDGVVVCDDGSVSTGDGNYIHWGRNRPGHRCQEQEAQITLSVRSGRVVDVSRPEIRDSAFEGTDLGLAPGPEAGAFFMKLALDGSDAVAKRSLVPAILARNATVWPELLDLARDSDRSSDLRRSAVFWLGQEAAVTVSGELATLARDESEDSEVRDAAVFALSQRPADEGVPALMELARSSDDPRVRKKAIFWLAQSRDPRVLPFFEEILLGGGS